jgi:hypothetical protein
MLNSEIASLPDRIGMFAEPFKDEVSVSSAPPTLVRTKRSIEDDAGQDDARQDDGHDRRDLDASHDGRRILECFPSCSKILKSDDASEDGTFSTLSSSDGAEARMEEEALDLVTKFLQVLSSKDTASEINSTATFEESDSPVDSTSLVSSEDFYFQFPDGASSTSLMTSKSVSDLLLSLERTPLQTPDRVSSKDVNEKVESLIETPPKAPHLDGFLDTYFDWTPPKTPPRILSTNRSGELLYNWDGTPPQTPENTTIAYSPFQLQHKDELGKLARNSKPPVPHEDDIDDDDDDDDQQGLEQTIENLQNTLATFSEDSSSTTSSGNEERRLAIYRPEDRVLMKDPTGIPSAFDRIMACFDPLGAEARTYNLTQEETFDTVPNSFSDDHMLSDDDEYTFLPCWNADALDVCIDDIMGVPPEESTHWKLIHTQESLLGSEESESDLYLELEDPKHNDVDGNMTTTGESHSRSDSDTYHTCQTQEELEAFRLEAWLTGHASKM